MFLPGMLDDGVAVCGGLDCAEGRSSKKEWVGERRSDPTLFPFGAVASYYIDAPSCEQVLRSVVWGWRTVLCRFFACAAEAEGRYELDSVRLCSRLMWRSRAEDAEHAEDGVGRVERRESGDKGGCEGSNASRTRRGR